MTGIRKKVLLVDDEPLVRKLTRTTLANEDYEIYEAGDGIQGLDMARKIVPDLILLDIHMPGMNGYEVSTRLRSDRKFNGTHIIILTARLEDEVREKGLGAGANDFFTKPFSPIKLLDKIHEHFDRVDKGEENEQVEGSPVRHDPAASRVNSYPETQGSPKRLDELEREQLLMYAMDLGRVYQEEINKRSELKNAYEKLKELEKMKDMFVALVSHELRTPLSVIKGYLFLIKELIRRSVPVDELSGFINTIGDATERLEGLIVELLDFSRMKSGLISFNKTDVWIPDILKLIIDENRARFDEKGLDVRFEVRGDFRPLRGDYDKLKDAFTHFVENAINFTDANGRFTVEVIDEGIWVVIVFRDTGCGIPEDKMDKIFNPFYQTADFLTREVGGIGLGLSLAKHVIEDHGGVIFAESEVGKGSRFTVKLPRSYQDAKEIVQEIRSAYLEDNRQITDDIRKKLDKVDSMVPARKFTGSVEDQRVENLTAVVHKLEHNYIKTLMAIARTVDPRHGYAEGHNERVAYYAHIIGKNVNPALLHDRTFKYSLLLHDIGKLNISSAILNKPEKLTDEEMADIRKHPEMALEILQDVEILTPTLKAVKHHHERWDGTGYPDRLGGEEIPLVSRIIAVADAFDAMTTDRPYRKKMSLDTAREEILNQSGRQFDPKIVGAFLEGWVDIKLIFERFEKTGELDKLIFEMD